ncbi:MAG: tetratricopeptide repeat protein [Parachlamydiaceae bacterium]|nr:tetratricopeptide repeat protein [Parachlamydiaceae bacterium]
MLKVVLIFLDTAIDWSQRGMKSKTLIILYGFIIYFAWLQRLAMAVEPGPQPSFEQQQDILNTEDEINDWEARLELARVLSYLKRYDDSLKEYQILIEKKPDSLIVKKELAKVLFYQGKTDQALEELLNISPENLDDATWIVLADIYRKNKNYDLAEKIYVPYLEQFPSDNIVRLKLAELLSWEKRYDESIYHYRIILKNLPNDIQVRRHYAQVLTWAGEDEEAVQEWKKTLE